MASQLHTADLGKRLKFFMEQLSVSGLELAQRAGVKPSFIYDIINGKSANPSAVKLNHVARSLGIGMEELMSSSLRSLGEEITYAPAGDDYVSITPATGILPNGDSITPAAPFRFSKAWLTRQGWDDTTLRYAFVADDGMNPLIRQGDLVIINTAQRLPDSSGRPFLLWSTGSLVARRLEWMDMNAQIMRIMAGNESIASYERHLSEVRVLGGVLWCQSAL